MYIPKDQAIIAAMDDPVFGKCIPHAVGSKLFGLAALVIVAAVANIGIVCGSGVYRRFDEILYQPIAPQQQQSARTDHHCTDARTNAVPVKSYTNTQQQDRCTNANSNRGAAQPSTNLPYNPWRIHSHLNPSIGMDIQRQV